MNSYKRNALGLGLLLVMSVSVRAQDTPPAAPAAPAPPATVAAPARPARQGGYNRTLTPMSLPIGAMNALLTLTDEQKTKIVAIQEKSRADLVAAVDVAAKREVIKKADEDIKAVLKPEQVKILNTDLPMLSMLNASRAIPYTVLVEVKLTDEQKEKIRAATKEAQDKVKDAPREERQQKQRAALADFKTTVEALLTDDQKKVIAEGRTKRVKATDGADAKPGANGK